MQWVALVRLRFPAGMLRIGSAVPNWYFSGGVNGCTGCRRIVASFFATCHDRFSCLWFLVLVRPHAQRRQGNWVRDQTDAGSHGRVAISSRERSGTVQLYRTEFLSGIHPSDRNRCLRLSRCLTPFATSQRDRHGLREALRGSSHDAIRITRNTLPQVGLCATRR